MTPSGLARAGVVALALLAAGCSSSSLDRAAKPGEQLLRVEVRDFSIRIPSRITAGTILFRVRNLGPETHELILVRAGAGKLPLRSDNLTVDERKLAPRTVGSLDDDLPGTRRDWTVRLAPGRYELFCNMSGHYLGGMRGELIVQ